MIFSYKAIEKSGEPKDGSIEAPNVDVAIASLQRRGLIVSFIEAKKEPFTLKGKISFWKHVTNKEIVVLSRQIATLFEAQVSALRVFKLISSQEPNPILQGAMNDIADDIQGGATISQAMAKHPVIFSEFYVNMVRAGEESGRLDQTFVYLADYLDRNYEVTSKAKNALIYPFFVVFTFVVVMILMFTLIIPKIGAILTESDQELPVYTKFILALSDFLVTYGIFFLALAVAGAFFLFKYVSTPAGKTAWDNFKLNIPYVGDLYRKLYLSRIADNLNTLISSGVTMIKSLEVTARVVGNDIYRTILERSLDSVKGGKALSAAFAEYHDIPFIMVQMVRVGEETGELGHILGTLSKFYQREVIRAVDTLVDLIEPVMIVVLGLGVGILIAAILVPIYNITQAF